MAFSICLFIEVQQFDSGFWLYVLGQNSTVSDIVPFEIRNCILNPKYLDLRQPWSLLIVFQRRFQNPKTNLHNFFLFAFQIHYTSYSLDKIRSTIQELATHVWETTNKPDSDKLLAVRKKYEDKKLSKIAKIPELTGTAMEMLKNGEF